MFKLILLDDDTIVSLRENLAVAIRESTDMLTNDCKRRRSYMIYDIIKRKVCAVRSISRCKSRRQILLVELRSRRSSKNAGNGTNLIKIEFHVNYALLGAYSTFQTALEAILSRDYGFTAQLPGSQRVVGKHSRTVDIG